MTVTSIAPATPAITLNSVSGTQFDGTAFQVSGNENYSPSAITILVDGTAQTPSATLVSGTSGNLNSYSEAITLGSVGTHTIQAKGADGTLSNTITVPSVAAGTVLPALSLNTPTGTIIDGSPFTVSGGETYTAPTLSILLDGAALSGTATQTGTTFSQAITITSAGSHTLQARGSDGTVSYFVTVTSTAPSTAGTLSVSNASWDATHGQVNFNWSKATGSNSTVKFNVDGKYIGTLADNAPDQSGVTYNYTASTAIATTMTAGSQHNVQTYDAATSPQINSNLASFVVTGAPHSLALTIPPATVTDGVPFVLSGTSNYVPTAVTVSLDGTALTRPLPSTARRSAKASRSVRPALTRWSRLPRTELCRHPLP